jgi:pyrophosphate--fructose-6-phosphate 1-phosphotransferase
VLYILKLLRVSPDSVMVGFMDGPQGIYDDEYCIVDDKLMDCYRNFGGFDMIGSGRHKNEKPEEFHAAMENCIALDLDGKICLVNFVLFNFRY